MNGQEIKKRIFRVEDINIAIAEGKKLVTTFYWAKNYCPRVEVLTLTHNLFSIVRILEGKEKGLVTGHWWPDREEKIDQFEDILKEETGYLYS